MEKLGVEQNGRTLGLMKESSLVEGQNLPLRLTISQATAKELERKRERELREYQKSGTLVNISDGKQACAFGECTESVMQQKNFPSQHL